MPSPTLSLRISVLVPRALQNERLVYGRSNLYEQGAAELHWLELDRDMSGWKGVESSWNTWDQAQSRESGKFVHFYPARFKFLQDTYDPLWIFCNCDVGTWIQKWRFVKVSIIQILMLENWDLFRDEILQREKYTTGYYQGSSRKCVILLMMKGIRKISRYRLGGGGIIFFNKLMWSYSIIWRLSVNWYLIWTLLGMFCNQRNLSI